MTVYNKHQDSCPTMVVPASEFDALVVKNNNLKHALDQIGFYFAGTVHQDISDLCLRVLKGESLKDIRRAISKNQTETPITDALTLGCEVWNEFEKTIIESHKNLEQQLTEAKRVIAMYQESKSSLPNYTQRRSVK